MAGKGMKSEEDMLGCLDIQVDVGDLQQMCIYSRGAAVDKLHSSIHRIRNSSLRPSEAHPSAIEDKADIAPLK